jgi:hypothetical protein
VNLNKSLLLQILHDMEDFARIKGLTCPPIFLAGGSGCIIGGYINRATMDFDLLDMNYTASVGRLFRMLGEVDYLDFFLTTIPNDFIERAVKLGEFQYLDIYVLSKEDIVVSKIGRYSGKDIEDIKAILTEELKPAVDRLIKSVLNRNDISDRVKNKFISNALKFRRDFHV